MCGKGVYPLPINYSGEENMAKKTLEDILGKEEIIEPSVMLVLSTEGKARSLAACNFRCYECNGSGRKYSTTGMKSKATASGNNVRYDDCTCCAGTGVLDYSEYRALGLDKKIK